MVQGCCLLAVTKSAWGQGLQHHTLAEQCLRYQHKIFALNQEPSNGMNLLLSSWIVLVKQA